MKFLPFLLGLGLVLSGCGDPESSPPPAPPAPEESPARVEIVEDAPTISVEEMVVITADGAEWLTPPQEDLILIQHP